MNVNGATNMTDLPVAQGIDLVNPNSSLHVGWNNVHSEYNQYIVKNWIKLAGLLKKTIGERGKFKKKLECYKAK